MIRQTLLVAAIGSVLAVLGLGGCRGPMARTQEEALRDQLMASHRAFVRAVEHSPEVTVSREPSDVEKELTPERMSELDQMAGPRSYDQTAVQLGADLEGNADSATATLSLERATRLAVQNNLDLRLAQLVPAVQQAQVVQAQAVFDAVFFANGNWGKTDTPRPPSALGAAFGGGQAVDTYGVETGIRKALTTGGELTLSTSFTHTNQRPSIFTVNPYWDTDVLVSLKQPLLRNFGADINKAQIELASSARRQSVEELRRSLLEVVQQTEEAYWSLVLARQVLLVQQRLLDRTIEDRNRLKERKDFDVSPVRLTEANSFVELRRSEVIRSRQQVRSASDALKRLINDPELPLSGEALLIPADAPAESPVQFSLLDAVLTALRRRPELQSALLQISDASVRQRVADNQRLPLLNLGASIRFNGNQDDLRSAYDVLDDGGFVDYLLNLQFEMPLGNRSARALIQQRQLERRAAVINYQRQAQDIVLEVKTQLRDLITAYELIGATRAARRAAADSLRAIEEQEKAGVPLTPEFLLDLKLATQQRVADAEAQEMQALTGYNAALARLYRAMGTLLERNGVQFADPEDAARMPR